MRYKVSWESPITKYVDADNPSQARQKAGAPEDEFGMYRLSVEVQCPYCGGFNNPYRYLCMRCGKEICSERNTKEG